MKNQDEIVAGYIEKIEQENIELKKQIKIKSKKDFYLFERGWWREFGGVIVFLMFLFPVIGGAGYLIWQGVNNVDTGEFYVEPYYNQNRRERSFCVYQTTHLFL